MARSTACVVQSICTAAPRLNGCHVAEVVYARHPVQSSDTANLLVNLSDNPGGQFPSLGSELARGLDAFLELFHVEPAQPHRRSDDCIHSNRSLELTVYQIVTYPNLAKIGTAEKSKQFRSDFM